MRRELRECEAGHDGLCKQCKMPMVRSGGGLAPGHYVWVREDGATLREARKEPQA